MSPSKLEKEVDLAWDKIAEKVLNNIKVQLLKYHVAEILNYFNPSLIKVVKRYTRHLPRHVAESEGDDLTTIAQLEFLETLKVWNPILNRNIWPLAQARIIGAMKDHIRYISKSDPSRFYEWMTDAAHIYIMSQDRADFKVQVETGIQLSAAMDALSYRDRKIVISHTKDDQTFKEIGEKLGISESQVSRIYKKAIETMKKSMK